MLCCLCMGVIMCGVCGVVIVLVLFGVFLAVAVLLLYRCCVKCVLCIIHCTRFGIVLKNFVALSLLVDDSSGSVSAY